MGDLICQHPAKVKIHYSVVPICLKMTHVCHMTFLPDFAGFARKEFRGKLAIAITANFVNRNTTAEAKVEEISGVAFIFNQKFFLELKEETGMFKKKKKKINNKCGAGSQDYEASFYVKKQIPSCLSCVPCSRRLFAPTPLIAPAGRTEGGFFVK